MYNKVAEMMDIDNFMSYMISQIFFANTDWPHNNVKIWKKKDGGKWRWILYDTDFGYNLYGTNYNHNSLSWALGEMPGTDPSNNPWSTLLLRKLTTNDAFRQNFIDRFCIQLSSTFEYNRSAGILDSLAANISSEISYHKSKWPSYRAFTEDITSMKTFALNRPAYMLDFISSRFMNGAGNEIINIRAIQRSNSSQKKPDGLCMKKK